MAGTSKKRALSPSSAKSTKKRANKRAHVDADVIVIEDPDDLEMILAQIKESEESERLAKRLQGSSSSGNNHQVIDVDSLVEDDAAMARRLAAEWGAADEPENEPLDVDAWEPSTSKTPSSGPSRSSLHQDVPPDQMLAPFRSVFTAERSCSKCGKPVKSPRGFVMFSASTEVGALPASLTMLLHAPCTSCKTNHCRGCFTPLECPVSCKGKYKNAKCNVESCCPEVRALAVFECLGGFDRQFLGERASAQSRALVLAQETKSNAASVGPGGTGYGMGGRGYGYRGRGRGRGRGGGASKSKSKSKKPDLPSNWEEIVVKALDTLVALLPSPYAESAQVYDMLPHASIGHLLSLSQLPELLGSLLRNDSVTDWVARSDTYYAMIALLRRLADCELTIQVLIAQRFCMENSPGLEEWMWEEDEISWETDEQGTLERAPPLYDHFKKLTKQCQAFMAGAAHMMDGGEEDMEESVKATSICGDIIAARDDIERAMAVLGRGEDSPAVNGKGKGKSRVPSVDLEKAYTEACEKLAFKHVEIDYSHFNYKNELRATETATRIPKNRLHLVKELATMATSLPPGIFIRVDEVRNDVIKIMIAGPEDTPYEGGLFEFDCFIPIAYPSSPPLMHLRTTGSGSVRFNPNLYNNGKVCLSLLGTWPGRPEEQWSPFKSTLLQVLVSIQSMILINTPYFNEPGHGKADPKARVSIDYNREISQQTCRWAIMEWMKDQHRDGIWKDVIASHFNIRQRKIRQRMLEWAKTNPSIRAYSSRASVGRYGVVVGPDAHGARSLDLVAEFDSGVVRVRRWIE